MYCILTVFFYVICKCHLLKPSGSDAMTPWRWVNQGDWFALVRFTWRPIGESWDIGLLSCHRYYSLDTVDWSNPAPAWMIAGLDVNGRSVRHDSRGRESRVPLSYSQFSKDFKVWVFTRMSVFFSFYCTLSQIYRRPEFIHIFCDALVATFPF